MHSQHVMLQKCEQMFWRQQTEASLQNQKGQDKCQLRDQLVTLKGTIIFLNLTYISKASVDMWRQMELRRKMELRRQMELQARRK